MNYIYENIPNETVMMPNRPDDASVSGCTTVGVLLMMSGALIVVMEVQTHRNLVISMGH